MLFNTYEFIFIFLPITFIGFFCLAKFSHGFALIYLSIASLLFYGYWNLFSVPILLISIFINFWIGSKFSDPTYAHRKALLVFGIFLNLGALGFFKYLNFLIDNLNLITRALSLENFPPVVIDLPIGISFFTFTQIAFLMDAYSEGVREKNFNKYFLFVTFFPHLIAGPILHHKQMIPQFEDSKNFQIDFIKVFYGTCIFTVGLAKKVILADSFAKFADMLFLGVANGVNPKLLLSWIGSISFTFQLYFDFSGYSDMAIGIAMLFGITLPINFKSPLRATSIIDFWQKWHISLTKYMGKYLYTPLALKFGRIGMGRDKLGEFTYSLVLPTAITFLIIGIWHGASWTFVIFGLMNGTLIIINHLWRKIFPPDKKVNYFIKAFYWICTFLGVNFCFVMFRSSNIQDAFEIYRGMVGLNGVSLGANNSVCDSLRIICGVWQNSNMSAYLAYESLFYILLGFIIILTMPSSTRINLNIDSQERHFLVNSWFGVFIVILLLGYCLMQFNKPSPFLYFQF